MKTRRQLTSLLVLVIWAAACLAQTFTINRVNIPDVAPYLTLQCDFHIHTVFSDGSVWPVFRVQEAVAEGLDAIAVTDHVEYQTHGEYVSKDRNASYKIAEKAAAQAGLILIPGAEITRSMPPGHINAIFIKDGNALQKENWKDAVAEAVAQGAILFWNHPGWEGQQPDGVPRWYEEHTYLYEKGLIAGIEVVNSNEYYPEVFKWCLEKKLAIFGDSDTHDPIDFEYGTKPDRVRPVMLVFAKERSLAAIREAIRERRTAVKRGYDLIGEEQWLSRIFENSLSFDTRKLSLKGRERAMLRVANTSGIPYKLVLVHPDTTLLFPQEIELAAGRTAVLPIRAHKSNTTMTGAVTAQYEVQNLLVGPAKKLLFPWTIQVSLTPKD